ncbi:MAG TPA: hypothetical protein PKM25_18885, partial [Candidatus Ozemobacteraceae bacterium]|nr:hypothetical protein [Candidatus Ozemobacteraceae bacterium]
ASLIEVRMLKTVKPFLLAAALVISFLFAASPEARAHSADHYKVAQGMPFVYFDIEDIFHQRWVSTYLRGRPIIILTGHRYQRYEILKWAESLKRDFGIPGAAHLLWVVNLTSVPWTTSRGTVINQWRSFGAPIPVLTDWHGVIGKATKVDYDVPNIIAIDADGRLAMHEKHTFTPEVYSAVATRLRALVTVAPGLAKPATPTPMDPAVQTAPSANGAPVYAPPPMPTGGKRGDSY